MLPRAEFHRLPIVKNFKSCSPKIPDALNPLFEGGDSSGPLGTNKSYNELIKSMTEQLLAAKDETIAALKTTQSLQHGIIAEKNAELMGLKGRLALRFVVEEFESKISKDAVLQAKNRLKAKNGTTPSAREATWDEIFRSDLNGIRSYLIKQDRPMTEDEMKRWIFAMQELYRIASRYIHNFSTDQISINAVWLTPDASAVAVAICEVLPVKYTVLYGGGDKSTDPTTAE